MSACYEDMENLDQKKNSFSGENFPTIYIHSYTLLVFSSAFYSLPSQMRRAEAQSWSSELKFSRDVCPLLRAACSHHSGPAAPRGACNSLFYSSVSSEAVKPHSANWAPQSLYSLPQLRTFTPAEGTSLQPTLEMIILWDIAAIIVSFPGNNSVV